MSKIDFIPDPLPEYGKDRRNDAAEKKYREALHNLPERGGGLHGALQSVCNLGIIARIPENTLYDEIKATGKAFKPHEIDDAIMTATRDHAGQDRSYSRRYESNGDIIGKRFKADPELAKKAQAALICTGGNAIDPFGDEIRATSNPPLKSLQSGNVLEQCEDTITFLSELYNPGDMLYIGTGKEAKGKSQLSHIRTAESWIQFFTAKLDEIRSMSEEEQSRKIKSFGEIFSFIIINPLDGKPTEEGSLRTDANVADFRYILCECDGTPIEQQIPLIQGLKLPVISMTFSGGKSIHALIDAAKMNEGKRIESLSEYKELTARLFDKLGPLGFDPATKNAARLSRLPGIWRADKNEFQTLLHLNKKGGDIMSGEGDKTIIEACPEIIADETFTLSELEKAIEAEGQNDPNELLKKRFLCKGHIAMIAAQTGCGKSSLIMQMIFCFALGRDCFGMKPVRPLKTLLIQGENDRRDLYEEITGIQKGLSYHANVTCPELKRAKENITVRTCTAYSGNDFLKYLQSVLSTAPDCFDLLVIDPLFSYAGCDLSKEQGKVSEFLRNGINTIIRAQNVGCLFVHHMNKPPKTELLNQNYNSTYDYAGSGEIANLMRAVIVLERLKDDESKIFYRLIAPKRGGRIEPDYCRYLAWATDGGIYWQEIEPPKQRENTREAREEEREIRKAEKYTELAKQAACLLKPGEIIPKNDFRKRFAGALKITTSTTKDNILEICIGQGFIIERDRRPDERFGRGVSKLVMLPPDEIETGD